MNPAINGSNIEGALPSIGLAQPTILEGSSSKIPNYWGGGLEPT